MTRPSGAVTSAFAETAPSAAYAIKKLRLPPTVRRISRAAAV